MAPVPTSDQEVLPVHRRLRRPAAALAVALLLPALAACGNESDSSEPAASDESSSPTADSSEESVPGGTPADELAEVSFEGAVGEGITATWASAVEKPTETTVTTLVEGDGEEVAEGDSVSAYLWLGNGTSQKEVYNGYSSGAPESVPNDPSAGEVLTQLFAGATYGSRVAAVTTVEALLGSADAGANLGVEADDAVVVVADLVEKAQTSPEPTDDQVHDVDPSALPSVVETDGKPTALDFSEVEEPALDTPVQRAILSEGDGAEVKASDEVTIDYLGATYDADAPFDESYSKGQPLTSPLSGLIRGWTIGLTGVKVGSRVLIQIPPAYGYGEQGSGAIAPNSTLWFVIDVKSVS